MYFGVFGKLLNEGIPFDFTCRNRRPPKDPVNALLSFGYSLLVKDVAGILERIGLDPCLGYLHSLVYGRPALALDMMEEFRPLIVDSTVLRALNSNIIQGDGFEDRLGGCYLNEVGRKRFFRAYQDRMNSEITHPVFGYTLSYRRTIELQCRFLAKTLTGELDEYLPFTVR